MTTERRVLGSPPAEPGPLAPRSHGTGDCGGLLPSPAFFPTVTSSLQASAQGSGLFSSFLHKNVWGKAKREASILGGISIFELVSCRPPSASLPGKGEGSVPGRGSLGVCPQGCGKGCSEFLPGTALHAQLIGPRHRVLPRLCLPTSFFKKVTFKKLCASVKVNLDEYFLEHFTAPLEGLRVFSWGSRNSPWPVLPGML